MRFNFLCGSFVPLRSFVQPQTAQLRPCTRSEIVDEVSGLPNNSQAWFVMPQA